MTNSENKAAQLNSQYFLPEFTFANATFSPVAGTELEIADGVIWLEDAAIIFQIKERQSSDNKTDSSEEKWFQKKVLRKATRQIRDTLNYFETNGAVTARNGRGQPVTLERSALKFLHKVVLYSEPNQEFARKTHHISETAGFIHLLPLSDYEGVVHTLCTMSELFEYFSWRESILVNWQIASELPEQALIGHYLRGDASEQPSYSHIVYLNNIDQDFDSFDVTGILHRFINRVYEPVEDGTTDYHRIIGAVARLNRAELRLFKQRFMLAVQTARSNVFTLPYRFSIPRIDCGLYLSPWKND